MYLQSRGQQTIAYGIPSSVRFSCSVVSDPLDLMNCSTPVLPVHNQLLGFTQTRVH